MRMNVRERILTIRLMEKAKTHPALAAAFVTVEADPGECRRQTKNRYEEVHYEICI